MSEGTDVPTTGDMAALEARVAALEAQREVGARLRQAMRGHVPKQVAADLGVSVAALSRWQHGHPIMLRYAAALCSRLDVSADWLLLGRGSPQAHLPNEPGMRA